MLWVDFADVTTLLARERPQRATKGLAIVRIPWYAVVHLKLSFLNRVIREIPPSLIYLSLASGLLWAPVRHI